MTPKWLLPIGIACGLLGLAWLLSYAPAQYVNWFRLFNGFTILAVLAWVIQRVLRYETALEHHRKDILELIVSGERNRSEAIDSLMQQTADIAKQLSMETADIAKQLSDTTRKTETSTKALVKKIETVLEKKDKRR